MERAPGRTLPSAGRQPLRWRVIGQYLPMAAFGLAAFLIARSVTGGDGTTSPLVTVDAAYSERLAANIAFFEERVAETNDSLSYNKLTGLYLQRVRETGDVSDVGRAELSATKSLEVAKGEYSGLINLAMVRIAQHDFEAAAVLAAQAMERAPGRADAYAILGDAQMALGLYDEAGANYRAYLEQAPGFSAFARQAVLAETRGNVDVAAQFWESAIAADGLVDSPENASWARFQLANLRFANGDLEAAESEYERALKLFPGYTHALAGLGRVAAAREEYGEAARLYAQATANVPNPEYIAALGDVYMKSGRADKAAERYALMGAIGQLFAANGIQNDLPLILFDLDHGRATQETLERARLTYERRPSLAAADVLGWALFRSGRFDEARKLANEALRLDTKDAMYLYHAGMIANAQGDTEASRELLSRALALNPEFHVLAAGEARQTLRQLGGKR